jgi:predicted Zn finger-like uncharacterized protein
MRVVCPSCDAAYDVPETVLTARPMLRCARCAHEFQPPALPPAEPEGFPVEAAEVAEPEAFFDPVPEAEPEAPAAEAPPDHPPPHADAVPRARRRQVLAGWAASFMVIVLAISLGISWRRPVMRAWPPSIRLYAVFGLHPN